jgi:hypothetical protein
MRSDHDAPMRRLERLSRLRDYDVDRNEPDPRGWTVIGRDGHAVGEVQDLIVDTERMTAIYLDVELDTKLFDLRNDDPHVLVPVERAHPDGRRLVVDEITRTWVDELRSARELNHREFWDRWWSRGEMPREAARGTRISRRVSPDDLHRVIDDVRPGETVRIPLVEEEIVVERRPVSKDEALREDLVVNRSVDEPPRRRR